MTPRSVVISSLSPDLLNTNWRLRLHVAEGFEQQLGPGTTVAAKSEDTLAVIRRLKPDLVLLFGSAMHDGINLREIRREVSIFGGHLAAWVHDDPYELDFAFRLRGVVETIFTNDKGSVPYYRSDRAFHLPLAASPTIHFVECKHSWKNDLFFCGVAFDNRIRFIREIEADLRRYRVRIVGAGWPEELWLAENRRIAGGELIHGYSDSAVTLNLGRDLDLANERYQLAASTPGPRTFEAAMAGSTQFVFASSLEVSDYFEPEQEIVLIDDPREVAAKLAALLENPKAIYEMRLRSQVRALRDHTYRSRAESILARI